MVKGRINYQFQKVSNTKDQNFLFLRQRENCSQLHKVKIAEKTKNLAMTKKKKGMYQICTKFEKSEIPMTKIFSVLTKVKIILSCFKKELPGERKTWQ